MKLGVQTTEGVAYVSYEEGSGAVCVERGEGRERYEGVSREEFLGLALSQERSEYLEQRIVHAKPQRGGWWRW